MPSTFSALDHNLPRFTGQEPLETRVKLIQDYQYQLLEQLRYILGNLDLRNFSEGALDTITDPIYAALEDADGNITNLALTAQGLQAQISDANMNITQLAATAEGLAAQISDANLNITSLQATAQGLQTRVSDAEGNISSVTQVAQGLQTRVSNAEGQISTVTQTVAGLTVTTEDGTTLIDGGAVYTDNLYVNAANITGTLTASQLLGASVGLLAYNKYEVGSLDIAYTTTGFGVSLNTNYGGIKLQSAGNIYLSAGSGGNLTLQNNTLVMGQCVLCLATSSFGDSAPSGTGSDGQLYFQLAS